MGHLIGSDEGIRAGQPPVKRKTAARPVDRIILHAVRVGVGLFLIWITLLPAAWLLITSLVLLLGAAAVMVAMAAVDQP
jgi:hypothetical protein